MIRDLLRSGFPVRIDEPEFCLIGINIIQMLEQWGIAIRDGAIRAHKNQNGNFSLRELKEIESLFVKVDCGLGSGAYDGKDQ